MKIERTKTHLVKPLAPSDGTPLQVKLSSSDLAIPRVHVEVLYAYNAPVPATQSLEEGLSKVLDKYREWAGRLTKDASGHPGIELNDAGAILIEAQADGNLQDMWPFNPSHLLLDLIPINRGVLELLLIQVTRFACGGMTLGVARHHQVADGEAASEFMEAWASAVKGLPIASCPLHDRSALMARDPPLPVFDHKEYQKPPPKPDALTTTDHPGLVIKKLHFCAVLLKKIKSEAAKGAEEGTTYSTFVSLLAHLWKCITKARGLEDEEGETRVLVAVNVRKRISPPLPEGYFGNAMCHTCPQTKMKDLVHKPLSFAAGHVHNAIKQVNNDYVRSALDFIELQQKNPVQIARTNKTVLTPNLSVTSWATLPLYNLDFGLGTPMFAGNPYIPFEGLVIFAPSHKKDGSIDVVLGLFAPDMERLEATCFDLNG
ncbi:hypothetical protein GOP47_0017905 [Adiantum capillus-veneris]|uniref:Uncharacterized protein n=1 Tax=Adiantum capillus-veneris TaxID=13818 RepID=A0A9D4UGR5_ADICA|nr:hypothetical protein GOP47_0017905 [Adiantum capillus-veneris]